MTGHHDRDAILAATDLPALADELLGPRTGTARTPAWRCPNPQHAQTGKTPPVTIFTSHRGEQRWRCHGCGTGGTAIDLVIAAHRIDVRGALEHLADRSHQPTPPRAAVRPPAPVAGPDPAGLASYVEDCARRLGRPEGGRIRRWLEHTRGIDPDVLRVNRIGADPGPRQQPRPSGMPRTGGAVLPVIADRVPVYAQVRLIAPRPGQPRYLNPAAGLAPNPRLSHIRPAIRTGCEILVTEGAIDALTAASAGRRAVAILGAGYPDEAIAAHLARLNGPLVLAFDPDSAGRRGGTQLAALLAAQHRPPRFLPPSSGDLNDRRLASENWPRDLATQLASCRAPGGSGCGLGAA